MSFNQFSNRSQNYGNVKGSRRDQIIAESRAKRKQRQQKKKHENAASIIQKWYRMSTEYNETIHECKHELDTHIKSIVQNKKNYNTRNLNHLLYLFRVSIFGFHKHPNQWKLHQKYNDNHSKWFTISLRRLYSIFLQTIKTSTNIRQHFISQVIDDTNTQQQMFQFQFLSILFIKYLELKNKENDVKELQAIIMSLWTMYDCNKWKYFDKISKIQQIECQVFCFKLLSFVFRETPFLSITSSILNENMKLNQNGADNTKTILALLHTIIIRYFQFHKIHKKQKGNMMEPMDIDGDVNTDHHDVVCLICIEILSIPFYADKLSKYGMESVIKSFISTHIWNEMIVEFEKYCIDLYASFVFIDKKTRLSQHNTWQKPIYFANDTLKEEQKQNKMNIMDIPDYEDYDDSDDDDDEMDDIGNQNVLQTFMDITEEKGDDDSSNAIKNNNTMQLYMNPNKKGPSLNKRKNRRNKRKRKKKKKRGKSQMNVINELPAICWTIHNLLQFLVEHKRIESNMNVKANEFVSFLNLSQIVFKVLDLVNPTVFPYDNAECQYDEHYLYVFDEWCCTPLLSGITSLIIANTISLDDYSKITKYILEIIAHFPSHKEHHIWSNLSLIPTENKNENKRNMVVLLYKNVFCPYNMWKIADWKSIIEQFLDGFHALSYFINRKQQRNKRVKEYHSSISQLESSTKCMQIFELFLFGLNHELRIIDDHQFHEDKIPFASHIWMQCIETFKYIVFIKYWKHYATFNKLQPYLKRNTMKNMKNNGLSPVHVLQHYCDRFEQFVSSTTAVFASLRDRNTRKSFVNDDTIWLMDKYIDLYQFEREILNVSDTERKVDNANDVEMNNNAFPQVYDDPFNPFSNREFGYNEMYGGSIDNDNNNNNAANQSQENLRRFEDNFNLDKDELNEADKASSNDKYTYRRSFVILIEIPFVIPFKLRVKLFYALIEFEKDQLESSGQSIRINRGNAIRTRIRRDNILDDGYRGLNRYDKELKTLIQIEFENKYGEIEAGIDGGGIFKEFLNQLIRDAFDPERGLFLETEYKKELYPNPNYAVFKQLMHVDKDYYLFLGKMVGKALYDSVLIEPIFSQFFLRKLLSQHNYVDDLQSFDIDLYKQLMSLKHDYSNKNEIENMEISFSVTQDILGTKRSYDLIPNGSDILVNHENRHKYIHILADYKLNKSMSEQSLSFLRGVSKVINLDYLRIFDATELSKLLSGDTNTKNNWMNAWKDLRENTVYSGGFHNGHRCVKWFWEILNNDLTMDDNRKFLMFVTSCTRSPLLGFKSLNPKFSIMCTGGDTTNLPTSQTCMNLLKLPNYSTKDMLKQKLLQSIRSNAGFDLS